MAQLPESGRPCTATRLDGSPCRHKAINGLPEQLCSIHAQLMDRGAKGRLRHGYYARGNLDHFEYLRRVSPADFVQQGGLAAGLRRPLRIRRRDRDLQPLDPALADIDLSIAELLHKMEILDALIFRARQDGLDILKLLDLYLQAASRLARLIIRRDRISGQENDDLLALLEGANAELEGAE
jgi:hypothetical protein